MIQVFLVKTLSSDLDEESKELIVVNNGLADIPAPYLVKTCWFFAADETRGASEAEFCEHFNVWPKQES